MAVRRGKGGELFSTKFDTAIVIDSSSNAEFVPIKNVIGDFFIWEIKNQIYVFKLGGRIMTHRYTWSKPFRFMLYETSHFMPLDPMMNKEIEQVLEKNSLPKINFMLFSILKELGRREKGKFAPHRLKDLVKEISDHPEKQSQYAEQIKNITSYLEHLKVEQIVTPVRKMADFLDEDLIETNPKFYGEIISRYKRTDIQEKKINNSHVKERSAMLKWILVIMMVGMMGVAAFMLLGGPNASAPDLSHLIPGLTPQGMTSADFQKLYTPESAKAAVDAGTLKMNDIPPELRAMVNSVKPPAVTAHTVDITP